MRTNISEIPAPKSAEKTGGFFLNLKVKTKIFSGFAVVLAVLIAVSAFGYNGFVSVSHDIDEYTEMVEEASLIARIEAQFLKLRSHAREFSNTGHEDDAKAVHDIEGQLYPMMDEAMKHLKEPAHIAEMERIRAALDTYIKDFAKAEGLERAFNILIHDKLDPMGADRQRLGHYCQRNRRRRKCHSIGYGNEGSRTCPARTALCHHLVR